MWDTAGQEKFRSLIPTYIRQSNIVVLVYDVTRQDSFDNIPKWFTDVTSMRSDEAIYILLANKIDLSENRQITPEQGKKYADEKGIIFQEVSAKTGEGFEKLFGETIANLIKSKFNPAVNGEAEDLGVKIQEEPKQETKPGEKPKKKKCC